MTTNKRILPRQLYSLGSFVLSILTPFGIGKAAQAECAHQVCANPTGACFKCDDAQGTNITCNNAPNCQSCTDVICPPAPANLSMRGMHGQPFHASVTIHPDPQLAGLWKDCVASRTSFDALRSADFGIDLTRIASDAPTPKHQLLLLTSKIDGPVQLVFARFGIDDLFLEGKILNLSNRIVTGYRIGWASLHPDGEVSIDKGPWMAVPAGLASGYPLEVPPQNVRPSKSNQSMSIIGFYVAAVRYEDGRTWEPDRSKITIGIRQLNLPKPVLYSTPATSASQPSTFPLPRFDGAN